MGTVRLRGAWTATRPAAAVLVVRLFVAAAVTTAGCGGTSKAPSRPDADAATMFDARDAGGDSRDVAAESPAPDVACRADAGSKKASGETCSCASDCASNFCVDGICCSTACTEACKTCSAAGAAGTCTFVVAGTKPRNATACVAAASTTCGFDGMCDGTGGCRRYVAGTICKPGTCDGDAVVGALACDGLGRCKAGPTTICAPYSCDTTVGTCFEACTQSSQCVTGQQCMDASCGKKMKGANCAKNTDCASGFCADDVCCNVACQGGCVSCAMTDRAGTCWPIDRGAADPRGVCADLGAATCGANGTCDGYGGCSKYAPETICLPATCTGTRRNTPGTCDGNGTCRPRGVQNCSPFLCTTGACTQSCVTDNDCETGHACVNGQCGKKNLGQPCGAAGECLSGLCVEGVCCDGACDGGCRSCGLLSTMGHCTLLAAGAVDSKGVCTDQGATTCGTTGRCDGSGGCEKYLVGTVCAPETCAGNVYTPPSTCSATGQCAPPDSLPCAPYVCNGNSCFNACVMDTNCVNPPNVCNGNSCGKKMRGASCSDATECQSTFCAQGVCCDSACTGACTSCALTGTLGTCTNVPTGVPDPANLCVDQGPASCATNGRCQAGACQQYAQGTACSTSTCPSGATTYTPGSTCDGQGACVTPAASSCFPFECGTGVCKATCTTDADCASPAVCTNGSCGLKGPGKTCADATECGSGFCAQGVCCDTACAGTCQSCVLTGSLGRCGNIADGGNDPRGRCVDQGSASCGTDGACDGNGACRVYAAGTACMGASCASGASTLTQVRTCDGQGGCKAATTLSCAPYLCNGISACKAACSVDADCLFPDICDPQTNLCGNKRRLGQTCGAPSDCLTGDSCVDGVCCSTSACGLCQTCGAGTCANITAGMPEPHGGCVDGPPCGNTGNCNSLGLCEQSGAGVACGAPSCTSSTLMLVSHCTGTGGCAAPATSSCSPYVCGGAACKTVCATDADCVAPFTCQGAGAARSCALKANGLPCSAGGGNQCISGNCVDGACCGSSSCAPCMACNVSGTGACAPVAAGTTAPSTFCADQGASTCGTNGKCDGGGACQKYINGTGCSGAICTAGATSLTLPGTCNGAGVCGAGSQSCNGFKCAGGTACPLTCTMDGDCAGGFYCTGAGGTCAMKLGQGSPCATDHQCGTNACVDNICCGTPVTCGACKACNVAGSLGTCANIAQGTDPKSDCADQGASTCGTDGVCSGAGACETYANGTGCSGPVCPAGATALTTAGACSNGSCVPGSQSCNGFKCTGGTSCPTSCNLDGDCATGFYCTGAGGTCVAKGNPSDACVAGNQCGSGFCVDNVCCMSACNTCQACNVAGSAGTCTNVGVGTVDPRHVCVDNSAAACGTNGKCNGGGVCQSYADGTICAPASCPAPGSTRTVGTCGSGTCGITTPSCAPYMCNGTTACRTTCAGNGDCSPGNFCALMPVGTCTAKLALGAACADLGQCGSGNCVDGVCCSSSSCGACQACAASTGLCAGLAAGSTPTPPTFCADQSAPSCGTDGKCDGNSGCRKYVMGTVCSAAICPAGATSLTPTGTCNGAGTCGAGSQPCNGYRCTGGMTCPTSCALDGDCATSFYCTAGGACAMKITQGNPCALDHECGTNACVDGVCCDTPVTCGACKACNVATSLGTCAAVAPGTDPKNDCADQGAASCGRDGVCDGAGACEKYADGTSCATLSCPSGSTLTLERTCALGVCAGLATHDCAPFKCDGAMACRGSCTLDSDCTTGNYCTPGGVCAALLAVGKACTGPNACMNGQCVDNVCCLTTSCPGGCQACAPVTGLCGAAPAGTDSKGFCPTDLASSCLDDGKCDGGGHCEQWPSGTICASGFCTPTTSSFQTPSTCDGSGTCVGGALSLCDPYLCQTDGSACKASCGVGADCVSGTCNLDHTCAP
jgi:hypothetical protein